MLSTDLVWIESIHAVKSSAKWDRDGEAGLVQDPKLGGRATRKFLRGLSMLQFNHTLTLIRYCFSYLALILELIDSGKQLARTRKFLTVVPLVLLGGGGFSSQVDSKEGELIQEKFEEKLANFLKQAIYCYDIVLDGLSFQDVKELIEEVQEARRIKLLHQPSKLRQDPCNLFHVLAKIKISPRTVCLGDYEMILILELHTQEWRLGPTLLILCEHLFVSFAICTLRKQTNKFTAGFKWKNDLDSDMVKQLSVLKRNRRWLSSFGVGASATFCCQAF
ncbi:hypothetical protein FNV43_RR21544 [Rhamnella rubrinervis]|uniref:Stomatal closure-related actin-binding protein coiled-coil domain-containing protein n=1 Tax=Rhamnella rubrinervis TaxID=2594499 RepID=A0A8K0E3J3_9ROSA|nr:hypothetical protein FNV43_RR21544 [Rhamnella rubrinervis]